MSLNPSLLLCSINVPVLICETAGTGRCIGLSVPGGAAQRHPQLIQRRTPSSVSGRRAPPPDPIGEVLAELERPLLHALVADNDAAIRRSHPRSDRRGWLADNSLRPRPGFALSRALPPRRCGSSRRFADQELDGHAIAPLSIELCVTAMNPDLTKAEPLQKTAARRILRKDAASPERRGWSACADHARSPFG